MKIFKLLKNKTWRRFFAAFVFGLAAALGTFIYLKILEKRIEKRLTPPAQEQTAVVVAAKDLKIGDKIIVDTVAVRNIPSTYVPIGAITPSTFASVDGAIVTRPVSRGRVIDEEIIDLNIAKDFSGTIREGRRAITITVDDLNSISGLIRPGNYVDIYSRISPSGDDVSEENKSGDIIIPVLDMVRVLATGKKSARPNVDEFYNYDEVVRTSKSYSTITLELSPEKAALLAVAREEGDIIAVLRNDKDRGGAPFRVMGRGDLFANSREMQEEALKKLHNRSVDEIDRRADGKLVTRDGVVLTDPNVTLNDAGLLVTKDGKVLVGRGLTVSKNGEILDEHGARVRTGSLVAGQEGVLVDEKGNVLASNGYQTLEGGFIQDKNGNIMTADGKVLKGVHVNEDGEVVSADGKVLNTSQLRVGKDGTVSLADPPKVHVDAAGRLVDENGNLVETSDILKSDAEGNVYTIDGKLVPGVHKGADGKYYDADGNELSSEDIAKAYSAAEAGTAVHVDANGKPVDVNGNPVKASELFETDSAGNVYTAAGKLVPGVHKGADGKYYDVNGNELGSEELAKAYNAAEAGMAVHVDADGKLVDANDHPVKASDLFTTDADGNVYTADGKLVSGVHKGADGKYYDAAGNELSDKELGKAYNDAEQRTSITGVTAAEDPDFINNFKNGGSEEGIRPVRQVEFIVGGSGNGVARKFTVTVGDFNNVKEEAVENKEDAKTE